MKDRILKLLGRKSYVPANVAELAFAASFAGAAGTGTSPCAPKAERSGHIARIKGDRYIIPEEADLIPGRIQVTRGGRGFLTPDDPAIKEIAIPAEATGTALHEDHVLVRLDVRRPRSRGASENRTIRISGEGARTTPHTDCRDAASQSPVSLCRAGRPAPATGCLRPGTEGRRPTGADGGQGRC